MLYLSSPIVRMLPSKQCGGTFKLVGAGTPLNTLPTISNIDPWHGQKNPPIQESSHGWGCISGQNFGAQPKCVQTPATTVYSPEVDLEGFKSLQGSSIFSEFGSSNFDSTFERFSSASLL